MIDPPCPLIYPRQGCTPEHHNRGNTLGIDQATLWRRRKKYGI